MPLPPLGPPPNIEVKVCHICDEEIEPWSYVFIAPDIWIHSSCYVENIIDMMDDDDGTIFEKYEETFF